MLLDEGRIVESDSPAVLLSNPNSRFYLLCKAMGKTEFSVLKSMAGVLDSWSLPLPLCIYAIGTMSDSTP